MKKALLEKLKESAISVCPVVIMILIAYITPFVDLSPLELVTFLICSVFLVLGISLFNLGASLAMTPMGDHIGEGLTKMKNIKILLGVGLLMGVMITIAEPDLKVLANQVSAVINSNLLIVSVGVGVGLLLVVAIGKIVCRIEVEKLLMLLYACVFAITAILVETGHSIMFPLSMDSGGVTTGPITVPFLMALGVGIASVIGGKNAKENSFGMIALCSIGPLIAVMILSIASNGNLTYVSPIPTVEEILTTQMGKTILEAARGIGRALLLILIVFLAINAIILKLPKKKLKQIFIGLGYTFAGLVMFLSAVNVAFVPVGYSLGKQLAAYSDYALVIFGFVIGCVVVIAEPAVHVLNNQVEEVTGGMVTKKQMLIAMSVGVGLSIGLSMLRIVLGFSLLYYIVPGYIIALILCVMVPNIYSAIAFDSGGVASGPLTSGFILPMAIGACVATCGQEGVLQYAFGIVAMVAMAPLITIQFLGFRAIAARKMREDRVIKSIMMADDEQIIYFDVE